MNTASLHIIASIDQASGGLGPFVSGLCNHLALQGQEASILTSNVHDTDGICMLEGSVDLYEAGDKSARFGLLDTGYRSQLYYLLQKKRINLLHLHSLWLTSVHHAAVAADRLHLPFVISTHGCLEPWALKFRAWKKRLALLLYQRRDFTRASGFHATAPQEAEQLRAQGIHKPIAVIPVGICLPALDEKMGNRDAHIPKTALFLSRIHPKKGILNLLNIWAEINHSSWQLIIAGNDDGNHLPEVLGAIRRLGLDKCVRYVGPVFGHEKDRLFRGTDLFVLPSYSENFGIVVAEALSYGVPVITTNGTPWTDLRDYDCGWYVGTDRNSVLAAMQQAISMPDAALRKKGSRGRALVEMKYQWGAVASDMCRFYEWLVGSGRKPDFVI